MRIQNKSTLLVKEKKLLKKLGSFSSLGVAFSGGVDSTFLLAAAVKTLGSRVVAMTGESPTHPGGEKEQAVNLAKRIGVRHLIFHTREMTFPEFIRNDKKRCYYCKIGLFKEMKELAQKENIETLAHGANSDDLNDYRPGYQASLEMGVVAPLADAGLCKEDIRQLAKKMGLPNWNKPAMACLATRIAYGIPIEEGLLERIDQAEAFVRSMGISACRVRHHDGLARIEVPVDELRILIQPEVRKRVLEKLGGLGYHHIALDVEGYVSGKMNRELIRKG